MRALGEEFHLQSLVTVVDVINGTANLHRMPEARHQAALADIFRPFYRVADARDRQSGGIGLGLSISQRAVEIHGGTVTAANAPEGGLLVRVFLPLTSKDDDKD